MCYSVYVQRSLSDSYFISYIVPFSTRLSLPIKFKTSRTVNIFLFACFCFSRTLQTRLALNSEIQLPLPPQVLGWKPCSTTARLRSLIPASRRQRKTDLLSLMPTRTTEQVPRQQRIHKEIQSQNKTKPKIKQINKKNIQQILNQRTISHKNLPRSRLNKEIKL